MVLVSVLNQITKRKKNHLYYTLGMAMQISDQPNEGPTIISAKNFALSSIVYSSLSSCWSLAANNASTSIPA
ncbi:hypothetical protein Tco_0183327 [Tanacetum coccineum]